MCYRNWPCVDNPHMGFGPWPSSDSLKGQRVQRQLINKLLVGRVLKLFLSPTCSGPLLLLHQAR